MCSVADPFHFDADPDPGWEKICYGFGSGSRTNFTTDPDPSKNDTDPDPGQTLIRIWIQAKMIRVLIQAQKD